MYHTITVVGFLGRDPEMRYTPSGEAVTNFSVAVSDDYNNKEGEKVKRTLWFRISTWGKQAEACNQYLSKGKKVLVEGKMVADTDTGGPKVYTKKDGSSGAAFEIRANTVRFLSSKDEVGSNSEEGDEGASSTENVEPF